MIANPEFSLPDKFAKCIDFSDPNDVYLKTRVTLVSEQDTQITRLTEIRNRTIPSYLVTPDDHTNNQAVVKTSAGAVYAISCFNASSSLAFFQIHDKATAPVNGDVPIKSIPVFANGATVFGSDIFGAGGLTCSTGIAWAFSSTRATLTLAVGSDKTSWVGWL